MAVWRTSVGGARFLRRTRVSLQVSIQGGNGGNGRGKVNLRDVRRNYARIAEVWMDETYKDLFYKASGIERVKGRVPLDIGDISGIGGSVNDEQNGWS